MRARSNPPARPAGLLARVAPAAILVLTVAIPAAHAADWQLTEIDEGTKPALALTPSGDPVIVYMLEDRAGWVRVASLEDGAWRIEQTSDGYFYGPPDIAIGIDGTVHAAFHDHQAPNFRPDKGDAVYLRREDGVWTSTIAMDGGHDGWDNRVTTDADGRVHMVAMDPVDFGGGGVEYYRRADDGTWQVEPIDSGPQTYRWAISIAMDPDGGPWITYYDARSEALKIAHRGGDGWVNDVVDAIQQLVEKKA